MYRRKDSSPDAKLKKVTLNLDESVYEKIKAIYSDVDASHAIRLILRAHVTKMEAKIAEAQPSTILAIEL
jgi:hypothetical protein